MLNVQDLKIWPTMSSSWVRSNIIAYYYLQIPFRPIYIHVVISMCTVNCEYSIQSHKVCKLNLSNWHSPLRAHILCHSFTFLSLVPHLCILRWEFTHHYSSSLELDRVYCSLENGPPVNLSVLPASPESWRAGSVLSSVAPSLDNLLWRGDLDRRINV